MFALSFTLWMGAHAAFAAAMRDCTGVVSRLERLACFDQAAGTRVLLEPAARAPMPTAQLGAPSVARVARSEIERVQDDFSFRLDAQAAGPAEGGYVIISAPAIGAAEPRPYLAISCVQDISRLQLITAEPIDGHRVTLQLRTEHRATSALPWQVLENGQLLDAGRGLPAIEQIKLLIGARRIHIVSDHPALEGLSFDASGLDPLIEQARKACRW